MIQFDRSICSFPRIIDCKILSRFPESVTLFDPKFPLDVQARRICWISKSFPHRVQWPNDHQLSWPELSSNITNHSCILVVHAVSVMTIRRKPPIHSSCRWIWFCEDTFLVYKCYPKHSFAESFQHWRGTCNGTQFEFFPLDVVVSPSFRWSLIMTLIHSKTQYRVWFMLRIIWNRGTHDAPHW